MRGRRPRTPTARAWRSSPATPPRRAGSRCSCSIAAISAGALAEIERALRIDASHGLAWRNAARMLDAQSPSLGVMVGRLLDAANPGAGSAAGGVAPRLVTATAEVARHDVLAGVYAHGHRVKNLLGIIGARARSARKLVGERAASGDLFERLRDLETDVTALYEEWAQYLRSMQAPTPTIELVPLSPLVHEVVVAAQARTQHVPIALETAAGLPDVRGDRMLLREALLNVVLERRRGLRRGPRRGLGAGPRDRRAGRRHRAAGRARRSATPAPASRAPTSAGCSCPGFTTKETGSGVGLAIAERVVAAHHGRITVDSEEGRGTTITITLPTDKTGLQQLPLWTSRRARPAVTIGTIVCVDDQAEVRRLLGDVFRARGGSVVGFDDGEDAIALARRQRRRPRGARPRPRRPTGAAASRSAARSAPGCPICRSSS